MLFRSVYRKMLESIKQLITWELGNGSLLMSAKHQGEAIRDVERQILDKIDLITGIPRNMIIDTIEGKTTWKANLVFSKLGDIYTNDEIVKSQR